MSAYFESLNRHLRSDETPRLLQRIKRPAPPVRRLRPAEIPREYATLRERLLTSGKGRRLNVLVFAGCEGVEGCTRIAREFAESMASVGLAVLLVDADIRTCGLTRSLHLEGDDLVAIVGAGSTPIAASWGPGSLSVVPGPATPPDAERFFGSAAFAAWLDRQRASFDYVIFDAPAALSSADAILIGKLCDGILLVAEAGHTRRTALAKARARIEQAGVHTVGLVLNRIRDPLPQMIRGYLES